MKKKVVAVSGYFDPIHVGHLDYLEMSKKQRQITVKQLKIKASNR